MYFRTASTTTSARLPADMVNRYQQPEHAQSQHTSATMFLTNMRSPVAKAGVLINLEDCHVNIVTRFDALHLRSVCW